MADGGQAAPAAAADGAPSVLLIPDAGAEGPARVALLGSARRLCLSFAGDAERVQIPGVCEAALRAAVGWIEYRADNPYRDRVTESALAPQQPGLSVRPQQPLAEVLDDWDADFLYGKSGIAVPPLPQAGGSLLLFGVCRAADTLGCRWLSELCCLALAELLRGRRAAEVAELCGGGPVGADELSAARAAHPFLAEMTHAAARRRNPGLGAGPCATAAATETSEWLARVGTPQQQQQQQ
eukprot:TRINITY_DN29676_c0_g1_i1.p2 TRINITY_DN29676_c0_g1~~TRINITY_DN29676_c0_g1_i1.p2  ORF type:complete len:258 (+),score=85.63 TRINITY_DN29676_c0_g1_i1:60-776(+)